MADETRPSSDDDRAVAQWFLETLAEGAGAADVLDAPWWMTLSELLGSGWTVIAPVDGGP